MSGEAWLYLLAVLINAVNLFLQVFFTIMYSDLEWSVQVFACFGSEKLQLKYRLWRPLHTEEQLQATCFLHCCAVSTNVFLFWIVVTTSTPSIFATVSTHTSSPKPLYMPS
jgi:hypothetical protein